MPKIHVTQSIEINAGKEVIQNKLKDFHNWKSWSPWLITEPDAKVYVREDGRYYTWEGKRVGSGEMAVLAVNENSVEYDLVFLKPWKSKAKTKFILEEKEGKTKVFWTMDSSLPFFLFFMTKKTEAFIGMDYRRGLKMLKEFIEIGEVNSTLTFLGIEKYDGCKFIGVERKVSMTDISKYMSKDFENLMKFSHTDKGIATGEWFSQYHKFDMVKQEIHYTAAVGVTDYPEGIPSDWIQSSLPSCNLHIVRHKGPYDYIGNAWTASQMMVRGKEFTPKKGISPIEFYKNSPQEVAPNELISDICFVV